MNVDRYMLLLEKLREAGVDPSTVEDFARELKRTSRKPKEIVFNIGQSRPPVVFVLSGYMKLYNTLEDGSITIRFLAGPGDFTGCINAIVFGSDSEYTAECITDCQLILIDHHLQQRITNTIDTRVFYQEFILRRLVNLTREKGDLLGMRATERYLYFRRRYPKMIERIPAADVADYLGIRPQSLSRIKQMLKNTKNSQLSS